MNKSVELLFINENGEILLGKRRNCAGEGSWALFGGHIEKNEDAESAAIRESKEELGIDVVNLLFLKHHIEGPYASKIYHRHLFLIKDYEGEILNMEKNKCYDLNWFSLEKLPTVVFYGHIAHFLYLQEREIGEKIKTKWRSRYFLRIIRC